MARNKVLRAISRHKVNRSMAGNIFIFMVLMVFALFSALPLYYAMINSLKPLNELWIFPPRFYVLNPTLQNYADLFTITSNSVVPFSRYIFNTCFITAAGTLGNVVFASMCAYPLAKHKFPGRNAYFSLVVLALMFNSSVTAIPNYLIMAKINWVDTYLAIIVPACGSTLGLYLMKQFMEQVPDTLIEAAKIDGAREWGIFWRIIMPSVKPAWLTLIVFSVQNLWNVGASNFIYSDDLKTLPFALSQITAAGIARAGVSCAVVVVLLLVPVVIFLFTQGSIIETMTSSGIKE